MSERAPVVTSFDFSRKPSEYHVDVAGQYTALTEVVVPGGGIPSTWRRVRKAELSLHGYPYSSLTPALRTSLTTAFLQSHLADTVESLTLPESPASLGGDLCRWVHLRTLSVHINRVDERSICPDLSMLTALRSVELRGHSYTAAGLDAVLQALATLPALETLKIWNHPDETLTERIGGLGTLRRLDLSSSTNVRSFPPEIGQLTALEALDFSGDRRRGWMRSPHPDGPEPAFTGFPQELLALPRLKQLNVARVVHFNAVDRRRALRAALPDCAIDFGKWDVLDVQLSERTTTTLDLSGLRITEIPPQVFSLSNLRVLKLGSNCLTEIPSAIGQLTALEALSIWNNQLSALPPEIGALVNLRTLEVGYWFGGGKNNLSTLPSEIGALTRLEHLNLAGCGIVSLPDEIAALSGCLRELVLSSDDGDRIHSNPICRDAAALKMLREALPETTIRTGA